jgi:hypothetical protein
MIRYATLALVLTTATVAGATANLGDEEVWIDVASLESTEWPREVECPLRLVVTLPSKAPGIRWSTISPRGVRCDHAVSVVFVGLVARKAKPRWQQPAGMDLVLEIKVDPSHDKVAEVRAEILLDDHAAARAYRAEIEVEEGSSRRFELPLQFLGGAFELWAAEVESAELRLTTYVVDD